MKLKTKIFFFTISIALLFSCANKKTIVEYKERVVKDTLIINKDRFITKQLIDTLVIENPCDSITGQLKDFDKEIRTDNAKVSLKSVKGQIQVDVNIDSIVSTKISEFKRTYKKEVDTKEVEIIRYKIPLWVWTYIVLSALIIVLLIRGK